ncbi:MAG: sugar ABC transporter permease [Chloroflexi bacterium]|nr:sugar ABC transporter permease [Chloroflexota bacterium]
MHLKSSIKLLTIIAVVLLALFVRLRAVELLPIDYDEDDYLRAAQQFATAIQSGDWAAFTQLNYRTEHPPLTKIVNGFALAPLPPAPEIPDRPTTASPASSLPQPHILVARLVGAGEGVLQVGILALLNPLGAFFLAIHTWQIKYTSQVMLEALPSLTSLVVVAAYVKSKAQWNRWLLLSAIALGLTAASKYTYCIVAFAVLGNWFFANRHDGLLSRKRLTPILLWGGSAIIFFFAADPYLLPDPINRLKDSFFYHSGYAQSEHVREAGYPMWQPLVWLAGSVPWHPGVFLVSIDVLIALFAIAGFQRLWQKSNVYALWFVIGLGFLLVWPTKWPQYILTLTVPLALAAAEGFASTIWEPFSNWLAQLRTNGLQFHREKFLWRDTRRALPWLAPGAATLLLITLFPLIFQVAVAMTDLSTISLRDGLTGGVWRATWQGITGQQPPVRIGIDASGRINVSVEVRDRGEVHLVPIASSSLSTKEVHFAGLDWFTRIFSGIGADILVFDVMWTVLSIGSQAGLGILIALMLNRRGIRFRKFWQTVFILPWAIPEFVGILIWLHMFEPENGWLALALKTPIHWQRDPFMALIVLLVSALWLGWPFMMLAASAGLKMIPPAVYDAAAVDGAGRLEQFRYITLPLLFPLLGPALIVRSIFAFNQFYIFYVMSPPWPLFTFSTLSFLLLNSNTQLGGQYAFSAVVNVFTVIVLFALLVWFNRRTRVAEGVTYA